MKLKKAFSGILSAALLAGYAFAPELAPLGKQAVISAQADFDVHKSGDYEYKTSIFNEATIVKYTGKEKVIKVPNKIEGFPVIQLGSFTVSVGYVEHTRIFSDSGCEKVTVPKGVKTISDGSFYECKKLTSVSIPESVNYIGKEAFASCEKLKSISLPDRLTTISAGIFKNCKKLEKLTVPTNVTFIGDGAFEGCESLKTVHIPSSVTFIGKNVFDGCKKVKITGIAGSFAQTYAEENNIPFEGAKEESWIYSGDRNAKQVEIPEYVGSLGSSAFDGCKKLKYVIIPDGVEKIGAKAFLSCGKLTQVVIPDSVTEIGKKAFDGCKKLTIYASSGSYAETYARKNGIPFETLKPAAPKKVTAEKVSAGKAKASWKKVKDADGYTVFQSAEKNGKFKKAVSVDDPKATEATLTGLKKGGTVYIKVQSYKTVCGKKFYCDKAEVVEVKV